MTVKQLIQSLQKIEDQNSQCFLSCDAEGNAYSPLSDVLDDMMTDNKEDFYCEAYSFEDNGFQSQEDWDDFQKEAKRVVVFYPKD